MCIHSLSNPTCFHGTMKHIQMIIQMTLLVFPPDTQCSKIRNVCGATLFHLLKKPFKYFLKNCHRNLRCTKRFVEELSPTQHGLVRCKQVLSDGWMLPAAPRRKEGAIRRPTTKWFYWVSLQREHWLSSVGSDLRSRKKLMTSIFQP